MNNRINPESAGGNTNIAKDENGIPPVLRENTVHVNYQGGAPRSTNIRFNLKYWGWCIIRIQDVTGITTILWINIFKDYKYYL